MERAFYKIGLSSSFTIRFLGIPTTILQPDTSIAPKNKDLDVHKISHIKGLNFSKTDSLQQAGSI